MGVSVRPATTVVTRFFCTRLLVLSSVAILCGLGCGQGGGGSAGGQVLRATGFFNRAALSATSYTPDTSDTVSLSSTISIPGNNGGFIGLENLQGTAPILTSTAYLAYTISGSSFLVPNDVFIFSVDVPPSGGASPTEVFAQLRLVSAARMDFLRANSGFLPPLPFEMTISVVVEGQDSAGDTFDSNPVTYNVTFTD